MKLLLATRSHHKASEIRRIIGSIGGFRLVDLEGEDVPPTPDEEGIEKYETFEENARAKALHFHARTGLPTVADDSGLVVDALGGSPGVRSKRFAPGSEALTGSDLDEANNERLLHLLGDLDLAKRTARYVCVAALVLEEENVRCFRGEAEGLILGRPRGRAGFGYDPLFFDRGLGKTFAEIPQREKNERSHRGRAFRLLAAHLRELDEPQEGEEGTE